MYALVDCNSFFCSVEKVFHPGLEGKPVVVLSNNDGCIVALTPEAKAVGLHRGDPIFKYEGLVKYHDVKIFSTNMQLYSAMSDRITSIMRKSIAHVEKYSIDESFLDLKGYEKYHNVEELMRDLANRIKLYTDIPVSVGIAPTKTLAKMGSKFAKQYKGYNGVCMIDNDEKRRKALELFDLSDVWGIGRHTFEKLTYYGIHTPLELADKSESWVRSILKKPGYQTWLELNGIPCIDTSEVRQKQTICTSRSFGDMVSDISALREPVASFASSCANKLRAQQSGCTYVTVFVASNFFREDLQQYNNSATVTLPVASSDTLEITRVAMKALAKVYVPGIMYKRAAVVVSGIVPMTPLQQDLFDPIQNRPERAKLMKAIDSINAKYGVKTVHLGIEGSKGEKQAWKVKCAHKSPNYLTNINEILTIKI